MIRSSRRSLFVLVSALALTEVMFYSALAPLLPFYATRLGLSKSGAGLLTAAYAVGTLLFSFPAGVLVARIGAKRATIFGATLLGCASVAFGLSHSIGALDLARFIQGAAGACTWTAALTWLVGNTAPQRRGQTVGTVLGLGIGGALLGPVVGSAARLSEPRLVFGAVAILIFALTLCAVAMPGPSDVRPAPVRGAAAAAARDPRLLAGMWFTVLPAALFGVLNVLAPLRLNVLGLDTVAIGAVFLVSAAVEASCSPLFGRLSDRHGPLPVTRVGLGASSALALILPLPGVAWLLAACVVASGLSFGISWVPASALLTSGADRHGLHPGLAYGLWNLAWALGLTFGSAAGAPLAQAFGDAVPYVMLSVTCMITLALLPRLTAVAA